MKTIELDLKNLKTYFMVAGITNAVAFLVGTGSVLIFGVATFGCGCVLIVLPLVNLTVMVFDFIALSRVSEPPRPATYSYLRTAAILDMVACFAIVPLIMGVMSIQLLGKPEVYEYFHGAGTATVRA